jgi:flagellar capping protein FliD
MTLGGEETPMNSTPNTKDVLIAQTDEQFARAREGIASVREGIARMTEKLSKMEHDDARNPSARPGDDARNPSARPDPQPPRGKSAARGSIGLLPIGLLLAACLVVAALVSPLARGAVTLIAARWTPQHVSTSFSQPTNPPLSAQPGPSSKLITAEAAPAQAAPLARTEPQDAAPAAAGVSELMQLQQATERDVANLKREIEQLKVKQDQIATDNSNAIEQLKAKLENMARLFAKVSEQSALPKTSPPSAGPTQSLQARMRPQASPPRRQYRPRWQYYDDEW